MRVLIAPQEFKGSLTAVEACEAIARGISAVRPDWELDVVPLADGGPGFLDTFRQAEDVAEHFTEAEDALGRPVRARFLSLRQSGDVIIEAAQANGIALLAAHERDPLRAGTEGVGQLLLAGLRSGPRRVIVGVGGSATNEGGAGMARRLGAKLLNSAGRSLDRGVLPLLQLAHIEWSPRETGQCEWVVATDVRSPLLGPQGAAAVFAPQKGAGAQDVQIIEEALSRWALVIKQDLGVDLAAVPGAGAGGGLAGGLLAFLGGTIVSGFDVVDGILGLAERVRRANIVITGEGSFDAQSLAGKGPGRLLELARWEGVRAVVFAGKATGADGEVLALSSLEPEQAASMAGAAELLARLARQWSAAVAL